ncbi:GPI transamidase component Gaa1 [Schizophyllum amplum]|uniref:GPI transamidase component Gaa1 n=1 Tax=Schizophyllum amplum TaxID=97359 RepID=A0A550CCZ8_9AGAR|nr:GPI transamidase component Gaa1 [Auriculariopsis ampla]
MLLLPTKYVGGRGTYIDENALQPGQVTTNWNWGDVHAADRYLEQLEVLKAENATSEQRARYFAEEFIKLGLDASTQRYTFHATDGASEGENAYAILYSPRQAGAEAIVVSASWISLMDEGSQTVNIRGVATVLALARYLKKYSLWAKDIIFIISDDHMDGMQAFLSSYHGVDQHNLIAEPLELSSGVIWTALNIDYPGHSFSHLGLFFEGLNGRLPNQDLLNSILRITRNNIGVPVILYDYKDTFRFDTWVPKSIRLNADVRAYATRARHILRHFGYQARGRASGVHGLFHRYRIDAVTVFAYPSMGPHGFHAIGRILESTLRTCNNLLERLHASFFFFLLVAPDRFLQIGNYLPSAVLVSVGLMFCGLRAWVDARWTEVDERDDKSGSTEKAQTTPARGPSSVVRWTTCTRPVLPALALMGAMHVVGGMVFYSVTRPWFIANIESPIPRLAVVVFVGSALVALSQMQLMTGNLPLCSIISVTAVLNFSLAALLAIVLAVPLAVAPAREQVAARGIGEDNAGIGVWDVGNPARRWLAYGAYVLWATGWLALPQEVARAVRDWDVYSVWFAPVVCVVYLPLVMQAALVCL